MRTAEALPLVSVIIPCRTTSPELDQCLDALKRLDYPNFEVLVITDEPIDDWRDSVRYLASGAVGPADKRDQGARESRGTILAFIDDDAYPDSQWLRKAVEVFADPQVAAVGGPGVTPPEDSFLARASGWISSSYLGGGVQRYRFIPEKARWVDDYPSMNFLVRRSAFEDAGGFGTHFFPGEDTKLCLAIVNDGGKIRYDPGVLVYHHRRNLIVPHLQQIAQYGIHRGHFARIYPRTSRRLNYALPSLWLVGLIVGPLIALALPPLWFVYVAAVALYGVALALSGVEVAVRSRSLAMGIVTALGIALTHVVYGGAFIKGFAARNLER
ncbi:MAG: glycosyltransferase [Chloroflexi bacterium]|nr:glycosyltransferase [Chloroflexota bacterium]MCY3936969.1 glycosyltransferase [Chloroflexota bacterium]